MTLTPLTMLELGTPAPEFSLPSPDGNLYTLEDQQIDKGLLVVFMCNHCPYVKHIRVKFIEKARRYLEQGITVVAINSNDFSAYPDDRPELMARDAVEFAYPFPYLVDEYQEVAKAYWAAGTPDFFLFDANARLVYRGQFDSARPGKEEPFTGADLSSAVDMLVAGESITVEQRPSMGCNIKWKPGNEPDYFT